MSKAFTRESDVPEEDLEVEPQMPGGAKNYITPAGHARLKSELKGLVEIERRIRFLMKRLEAAEVVDPRDQDQVRVFFGATVRYADPGGGEHTVSIVGTDEVDPAHGRVSWVSPVARALIRSREGETVTLRTPAGEEQLEVLEIR